jgi:uncharacterized alpha-E superfamily protein
MLGRTAYGIVWMFRYLERAENTARLLEAGFRMALMRGSAASGEEWRSVLITLGQEQDFDRRFEETTGVQVMNFILRDRENPGSVLAMIEAARTNARMVRTAITREVWETINETWMSLGEALARPLRDGAVSSVLALIRRQALLVRGALEVTMLRNEIFNFARIGAHLEGADNTARILDVKYHVLLPSLDWVGSELDIAQWELMLRSVAGERVFRWLNAGRLDPRGIAEFLIFDGRFPRSLAYCYAKLASNMNALAREYGGELPSQLMLKDCVEKLKATTISDIVGLGLHEFLTGFLTDNDRLAEAIGVDYRFLQ